MLPTINLSDVLTIEFDRWAAGWEREGLGRRGKLGVGAGGALFEGEGWAIGSGCLLEYDCYVGG